MIVDNFNINRVALGDQDGDTFGQGLTQFPAKIHPPLFVDPDTVLAG
jgi:hypothetical protein